MRISGSYTEYRNNVGWNNFLELSMIQYLKLFSLVSVKPNESHCQTVSFSFQSSLSNPLSLLLRYLYPSKFYPGLPYLLISAFFQDCSIHCCDFKFCLYADLSPMCLSRGTSARFQTWIWPPTSNIHRGVPWTSIISKTTLWSVPPINTQSVPQARKPWKCERFLTYLVTSRLLILLAISWIYFSCRLLQECFSSGYHQFHL